MNFKIAGQDGHNAEIDRKNELLQQSHQSASMLAAVTELRNSVDKQVSDLRKSVDKQVSGLTSQIKQGDEDNAKNLAEEKKISKRRFTSNFILGIISVVIACSSLVIAIISLCQKLST